MQFSSGFGNTTVKVTESVPTFPDLSVHVTVQVLVPSTELIPVIVLTPFAIEGIFIAGLLFNL